MRTSKGPIDPAKLAWEPMNDVLRYKLLNGNLDSGAHTMILQSDPRAAQDHRGQYHPADEEFYCLAGDFTFDGSTWFTPGSYAFYPAYFVHGMRVYVRGGYEVYLRIGGTNDLFWEDNPKDDVPYPKSQARLPDYAMQLPRIEGAREDISYPIEGVCAVALHRQEWSSHASTSLTVEAGTSLILKTSELLEIFVLDGAFETMAKETMGLHSYLCYAQDEAVAELHCKTRGHLLISHNTALLVSPG